MVVEEATLHSRLAAQRKAYAVMLGITCAGFWADAAFYVITLHAIVWAILFLSKSTAIHDLELVDAPTLHKNPREVTSMKKP